jgi:hypothetical protein
MLALNPKDLAVVAITTSLSSSVVWGCLSLSGEVKDGFMTIEGFITAVDNGVQTCSGNITEGDQNVRTSQGPL